MGRGDQGRRAVRRLTTRPKRLRRFHPAGVGRVLTGHGVTPLGNDAGTAAARVDDAFVVVGGVRRALYVLDSITEAVGRAEGAVVVSGSHGGLSAGRFALQARVALAVFNDAGVGKDGAGIAALALLDAQDVAGCAVSHDSACIGNARSTLQHGVLSHVNAAAAALGARPGLALRDWLHPD